MSLERGQSRAALHLHALEPVLTQYSGDFREKAMRQLPIHPRRDQDREQRLFADSEDEPLAPNRQGIRVPVAKEIRRDRFTR